MIDARDYLQDGWPTFSARDKLPLLALIQGAAQTSRFVKKGLALGTAASKRAYAELKAERDAVCLHLLLPAWWHYAPTRQHRCQDKRRPAPEPVKPLYWRRR